MTGELGPPAFDPPVEGGVVAGFDGSRAGVRVLAWAVAEAAAHAEPLHVVRAWALGRAVSDAGAPFGVVPSAEDCRAALTDDAGRCVAEARQLAGDPDVVVHLHVVRAPADVALEAAARRARILVVGHRGRGRLPLVLGSVTERVLSRVSCPVVVIRLSPPAA